MSKQPYANRFAKAQPVLGVDGTTVGHCAAGNPAAAVYTQRPELTVILIR